MFGIGGDRSFADDRGTARLHLRLRRTWGRETMRAKVIRELVDEVRDPMSGRLVGLGTFATKGAADKALALALADQTRGGWVDPARGRVTLADYSISWLDDRRLRPRTQELYEGLVRLHIVPALGELELGRLTPSIIRRWHSRMAM